MRGLRFALAGAAALAEAAIAIALVFSSHHDDNPWLIAVTAAIAGLTFVAAGLVALWRRPDNATGFLLAATGYLWFLGALTESNDSWVWTIGFVAGNLALISFAALILAFPDGTLDGHDRLLVAVGGLTAIGSNAFVALVDSTPVAGCAECPPSAIAVADLPRARDVVVVVASAVVAGVLVLIAATLVRRWRRASAAQKRTLSPVYVSCGVALSLLLVSVAAEQVDSRSYTAVWLLFLAAFAAVPLSFLAGVLRSRLDRAAAARLLVALDKGTPLRDALAEALHDPSLEVVYWLEDGARWVDADGRAAGEPSESPARSVTMVERNGKRVAALLHDPALDAEPDVVSAIAAAAGLSLQNERLGADLRAQYHVLETVANTAPSVLVVIDTEGRILSQNRAAVAASGLDDEGLISGRLFWDVFMDPDERAAVHGRFLDAAPEFPPEEHENTFTNARGERLVIEWRSAPIADETGRVVSIVAGGTDITERKRREVQLQRERDITETLMQAIPSFVVVVDTEAVIVDSGVDETRAGVNDAFRAALGWPDVQLVRRSVLELIDPGDRRSAQAAITSAANGVAAPEQESRWLRADGERVIVAWRATPVADVTRRRESLVLVSGIDVTERKHQEQEIRASRVRIIEAADEARRLLERNLHDGAQQRLVSLSVSLRLAESRTHTDPATAAAIIAGARDELAAALGELRELARGIHPAVLTDRGLAAAVEAVISRFPLPVELELPDERLPAPVEAAAYYVISEALTNIVKYARASAVRVSIAEHDGQVTVEVSDDGVGGADPDEGSGLRGLSDRIAALDGALLVESPAGEGTLVVAVLPVRRAAPSMEEPQRIPPAS